MSNYNDITQVNWVIEKYKDSYDVDSLITDVKLKNMPCHIIDKKCNFSYNHISLNDKCVVVYGSIRLTNKIKSHFPTCSPVTWTNDEDFKCNNYFTLYRQYLFNDHYEILTVKQIKDNKWDIYDKYSKEAMIFIRPNDGDKKFTGQLLDLQDFDRFWNNCIVCNAEDNDLVIVSTPKNIKSEFRYIVSNERDIISYSCYQYQGKQTTVFGAPKEATELVKKLLEFNTFPAKVYVMDIAQDSDNNFWLLELNSFNNSGLYAAKTNDIVDKVSKIALKEYNKCFGYE